MRLSSISLFERDTAMVEKTFQEIEKTERYNFPNDGDPTLYAACEALSGALQKASKDNMERDTTEVKQALDNLRKAYDKAAESNTVVMHYIDVEPPCHPYSPLFDDHLGRILLARSWRN
jgi:hypothetical protein